MRDNAAVALARGVVGLHAGMEPGDVRAALDAAIAALPLRDDPAAKPTLPEGPPPSAERIEAKPTAPAEDAPERMTQEEYENDPLIAQAMELFDAKIAPAK